MLHPLMPREKREMDLRTGRRDDKFRGRNFCRSLYGSWPINGLGPRARFATSSREKGEKVLFAYEIPFSLQWNGSKARRDEERERDSLVTRWW